MSVIYLKSCPKCQGDLERCEDANGSYLRCMQCGRYQDLLVSTPFRKTVRGHMRQGPYLPTTPSNYKPWREREQQRWEEET